MSQPASESRTTTWSFTASDLLLRLAVFAAEHTISTLTPDEPERQPPRKASLLWIAGEKPGLRTFEPEDGITGLGRARQAVAELPEDTDAYAVAADARVTVNGDRVPAVIVEAAERGADVGMILAQRYEPATADTPAARKGNPVYMGEAEQLLPIRPQFGAGLGYGAFVYLPDGAGATLDAAAERLRAALPDVGILREQARLLLDIDGWELSVGLVAGPRVAAEAAKVAERVAADDPGAARFGGTGDTPPWSTRFEVRTAPDPDMDRFDDYLLVTETLAEPWGGEVVDRASYPV